MRAKLLQSCLTLCDPGTIACLPGPSVHEIRHKSWSGLPCSPPGDLPYPGIEPTSLTSSLAGGFFTTRIIWDVSCHGWLISPHKHTVLQARVHCARHSPTLTSLRSHVSLPLLLHTLPTCSDHLLSPGPAQKGQPGLPASSPSFLQCTSHTISKVTLHFSF